MSTVAKILAIGAAVAVVLLLAWMLFLRVVFRAEYPHLVEHLVQFGEPKIVDRLEVSDESHAVLWALENKGATPVQMIDYGVIPEGFEQVVPASGAAPRLHNRAWVRLSLSVPEQRYVHVWNQVTSRNRFYRAHMQFKGEGCDTPRCDEVFLHWQSAEAAGGQ